MDELQTIDFEGAVEEALTGGEWVEGEFLEERREDCGYTEEEAEELVYGTFDALSPGPALAPSVLALAWVRRGIDRAYTDAAAPPPAPSRPLPPAANDNQEVDAEAFACPVCGSVWSCGWCVDESILPANSDLEDPAEWAWRRPRGEDAPSPWGPRPAADWAA